MNKLFSMRGRISRSIYAGSAIPFSVFACLLVFFLSQSSVGLFENRDIFPNMPRAAPLVLAWVIAIIQTAIVSFLQVKRLHDLSRPGWHFWLLLIPVYGIWLSFVLLFSKGCLGRNEYGEAPSATDRANWFLPSSTIFSILICSSGLWLTSAVSPFIEINRDVDQRSRIGSMDFVLYPSVFEPDAVTLSDVAGIVGNIPALASFAQTFVLVQNDYRYGTATIMGLGIYSNEVASLLGNPDIIGGDLRWGDDSVIAGYEIAKQIGINAGDIIILKGLSAERRLPVSAIIKSDTAIDSALLTTISNVTNLCPNVSLAIAIASRGCPLKERFSQSELSYQSELLHPLTANALIKSQQNAERRAAYTLCVMGIILAFTGPLLLLISMFLAISRTGTTPCLAYAIMNSVAFCFSSVACASIAVLKSAPTFLLVYYNLPPEEIWQPIVKFALWCVPLLVVVGIAFAFLVAQKPATKTCIVNRKEVI